ncbi:hypothetical protein D9M70_594770 [compost metagenome]
MVQVAVVVNLLAVGGKLLLRLLRHRALMDLDRFIGLPPTCGRATVEYRHAHQFAHRGNAENAHLTGLTGGPEAVIVVQLARCDRAVGACRGTGRCRQPCSAEAECGRPYSARQDGAACSRAKKRSAA